MSGLIIKLNMSVLYSFWGFCSIPSKLLSAWYLIGHMMSGSAYLWPGTKSPSKGLVFKAFPGELCRQAWQSRPQGWAHCRSPPLPCVHLHPHAHLEPGQGVNGHPDLIWLQSEHWDKYFSHSVANMSLPSLFPDSVAGTRPAVGQSGLCTQRQVHGLFFFPKEIAFN